MKMKKKKKKKKKNDDDNNYAHCFSHYMYLYFFLFSFYSTVLTLLCLFPFFVREREKKKKRWIELNFTWFLLLALQVSSAGCLLLGAALTSNCWRSFSFLFHFQPGRYWLCGHVDTLLSTHRFVSEDRFAFDLHSRHQVTPQRGLSWVWGWKNKKNWGFSRVVLK